jgi:hypothetical protein
VGIILCTLVVSSAFERDLADFALFRSGCAKPPGSGENKQHQNKPTKKTQTMKTKSKNSIPRAVDPVTSLGAKALIGGQSIGALIPLVINTPPKIATDFYDFAGNPATPEIRGKQAKYTAQKTVVTDAYAAARQAVSAGRDFCMDAISVLKPVLGNRWNSQWNRAGFVAPSLAVERDPVPMLIRLREYFNANAAQEVASRGVTAAQAQVRVAAIQAADLAVAQARGLADNAEDRAR